MTIALIADFGLAVHDHVQHEKEGEFSGTLPYMSPEQVRAEVHRLDGRADIWALGTILYEMLTGRRPFVATSREALAKEILERDPKPLRQIDRGIPVRLESTCLRCLAKLPANRYASAADLASDLARCMQPSRRRFWLAVAVFLVSATCLFGGFLWYAGTDSVPANPLDATLDLLVSAGDHTAGAWLPLGRHEAAPVRSGSLISCIAELNQPAYAYLIWIDHEGIATPLYPWRTWGDGRIAQETQRLDGRDDPHLTTVIQSDSDGTETVMLLARHHPLSAEEEDFLFSALGNLGPQTSIPAGSTLRFDNGQMAPSEDVENTLVGETDDNSVIMTQRKLYERLKDHFEIIRANSFAVEENADQEVAPAIDARTAVTGYVDVFVWSEDDATRRAVPLRDPGARPLRTGDLIRLNVRGQQTTVRLSPVDRQRGEGVACLPMDSGPVGGPT